MSCSHTKEEGGWMREYDEETGEPRKVWGIRTVSAYYDLDLHRYKCSMCGEIGYYSGAARAYHEDGVKSNIKGLGGL